MDSLLLTFLRIQEAIQGYFESLTTRPVKGYNNQGRGEIMYHEITV